MPDLDQHDGRSAGVLLHPTSLPSGKIDIDADRWLAWLQQAGFSVWQMLPLGVPYKGLSPYQCQSAFALNPDLLSYIPELAEPLAGVANSEAAFQAFIQKHRAWLDDYSLFVVLNRLHAEVGWVNWPDKYKYRDPTALAQIRELYADELAAICWQQFYLHHYWTTLRAKAHQFDIRLFGDLPIFVAYESADVWAHPEMFLLDERLNPTVITGVPPDYFSETGQRWNNPHYNWDTMQSDGYTWWLTRFAYLAEFFDMLRIDHFRGLVSVWQIQPECDTAVDGQWVDTPGHKLMLQINRMPWQLDIVAEDLGVITDDVERLRKEFNLPGMSVLQFAFHGGDDNPHHPDNITCDRIVYTGTHDNDTLLGWYQNLTHDERAHLHQSLGSNSQTTSIDRLKQIALDSPADLAIFPLQDLLNLDSRARMNIPGTIDDNWRWQFDWSVLTSDLAGQWHKNLEMSGRL